MAENQSIALLPLEERPLATFALLAYNQERFIRQAVASALAQDYSPLEIIISDDCSQDRTFEIISEIVNVYTGPHKIILNRNAQNIGVSAHFSKIVELASGEYVVLAAGDDISFEDRVSVCINGFLKTPEVSFIQTSYINFSGDMPEQIEHEKFNRNWESFSITDYLLDISPVLLGASRAIKKSTFLHFPALCDRCPEEDKPSILRLLTCAPVAYTNSPTVYRRIHESNLSSSNNLFKMSSDELLSQFLTDVNFAERMNLIDNTLSEKISLWAKKYIKRRILLLSYEHSQKKLFDLLFKLVPSRAVSFKQKLRELKKLLVS